MCCACAIVVGLVQLVHDMPGMGKTPWRKRVRRYPKLQVKLAKALLSQARRSIDEPFRLPEREEFQSALGKVFLVIVSKDNFNTIIYYRGGKTVEW